MDVAVVVSEFATGGVSSEIRVVTRAASQIEAQVVALARGDGVGNIEGPFGIIGGPGHRPAFDLSVIGGLETSGLFVDAQTERVFETRELFDEDRVGVGAGHLWTRKGSRKG